MRQPCKFSGIEPSRQDRSLKLSEVVYRAHLRRATVPLSSRVTMRADILHDVTAARLENREKPLEREDHVVGAM
jgi:hypothetical protein